MNIVIRISHPAHVYKFKNLIGLLKESHIVFVVTIEKEMTTYLLNKFGIEFYLVGQNRKGLLRKVFGLFIQECKLCLKLINFKPDIFIGGGDPLMAHVSLIYNKPYLAFEDTEVAKLILASYRRIAASILTPESFLNNLGNQQIRYKGFHELAYLHNSFFKPKSEVLKYLSLGPSGDFIILRFVSWIASHDIGVSGFTRKQKINLVEELSKHTTVFISSEGVLPEEIRKYKISFPPEMMHDALYYAKLYIGEGATMASESALLGTPAIYINPLIAGIIEEEKKVGLLYQSVSFDEVLATAKNIINDPVSKTSCQSRSREFQNQNINVTFFWYWFIVNYPESKRTMKENPEYQARFK